MSLSASYAFRISPLPRFQTNLFVTLACCLEWVARKVSARMHLNITPSTLFTKRINIPQPCGWINPATYPSTQKIWKMSFGFISSAAHADAYVSRIFLLFVLLFFIYAREHYSNKRQHWNFCHTLFSASAHHIFRYNIQSSPPQPTGIFHISICQLCALCARMDSVYNLLKRIHVCTMMARAFISLLSAYLYKST